MIAGKGHEDYQIVGDDGVRLVARAWLGAQGVFDDFLATTTIGSILGERWARSPHRRW